MLYVIQNRELHEDGDDGISAVVPFPYSGNGVRLYDGYCGNSGDEDSIHGSTAVGAMP